MIFASEQDVLSECGCKGSVFFTNGNINLIFFHNFAPNFSFKAEW